MYSNGTTNIDSVTNYTDYIEEAKKDNAKKEDNKKEEPAAESTSYTDLFESFLGGNY